MSEQMTLAEAVDQMCAESVPAAWITAIDAHLTQHAAMVAKLRGWKSITYAETSYPGALVIDALNIILSTEPAEKN